MVCVRHCYPDAYRLFATLLPRFDIRVDFVDGRDAEAVERALPGAKVLYLESPTSMVFETQDLARLAALARARRRRLDRRQLLGRARSSSARSRTASTSWCTRPRNIWAATATWSRAWSAAGAS